MGIWILDAEYQQLPGHLPITHCVVGREVRTGQCKVWRADQPSEGCPFQVGQNEVVVCYAAAAEGNCFLELGWKAPPHVLDLHAAYSKHINTHRPGIQTSLLSALDHFGLPHLAEEDKERFRGLAIRGGPYSREEMDALVHYCHSDVICTHLLFERLWPHLDLPRDLLDGRYTFGTVPRMERRGIPMDVPLLKDIQENWPQLRERLKQGLEPRLSVYNDGGEFSHSRFRDLLSRENIPWPKTPTGRLCTDAETFKTQGALHPQLLPLISIQLTLANMRKFDLPIGPDGRNRCSLRPFASRTGRNQPRGSEFVFGPSAWVRMLIKPPPDQCLVSLDFAQQEFLIAAALSGDLAMIDAYNSGDPYLQFAKLAGSIPSDGTKMTHGAIRDRYKTAVLAIQYGSSEHGLAGSVGGRCMAQRLIADHKRSFPRFWAWTSEITTRVTLDRATLKTPFGWRINCDRVSGTNLRSVANWPVQAAGADIMRIAAMAMVEHGLPVAAPIHDAFLLVCPNDKVKEMTDLAQRLMAESSKVVLGHSCRVEVKSFAAGERYGDSKGEAMFKIITSHLNELKGTPL